MAPFSPIPRIQLRPSAKCRGLIATSMGWRLCSIISRAASMRRFLEYLGRRLAGLGAEYTAELARTQTRRLGELSNRQLSIEIALRICQRALDAVGFGLQLQECRKLRLATGTPVINDQLPGDSPGHVRA